MKEIPTWRERAACLTENEEVFYSDDKHDEAYALRVCNGSEDRRDLHPPCPVRTECLLAAMEHEKGIISAVWGVWGGLRVEDRKAWYRKQRVSA